MRSVFMNALRVRLQAFHIYKAGRDWTELDILCFVSISYAHLVELLGSLSFIFSSVHTFRSYYPEWVDDDVLSFHGGGSASYGCKVMEVT
ncbi:hypothetical protein BDV18DRAFT_148785 [Aspergillus unguis]